MIQKFKIGNANIEIVLRHMWDGNVYTNDVMRGYELGVFFRRRKIVGSPLIMQDGKAFRKLVNSYMIGFRLIYVKVWLSFNVGGLDL
jgi:hypothetical protein